MTDKVTVQAVQQMKNEGEKIVGMVVWDYQMARIIDRVGVEIMSVGDSVGVNLWGHPDLTEITMDEMITVTKAVRRGTERAILSADFPYGPLQQGLDASLDAARRFVDEAGVDMIKLDGAAEFPDAVAALTEAGIPVWAQFGITPQTAMQYGIEYSALGDVKSAVIEDMQQQLLDEAKMLADAGAVMLDFTNSGRVVGPAVTESVTIPVLGGFGGGPWLDGRVRMANAAMGYEFKHLDEEIEAYANVARIAFGAAEAFANDVRAGRQIKGGKKK